MNNGFTLYPSNRKQLEYVSQFDNKLPLSQAGFSSMKPYMVQNTISGAEGKFEEVFSNMVLSDQQAEQNQPAHVQDFNMKPPATQQCRRGMSLLNSSQIVEQIHEHHQEESVKKFSRLED